MILIFINIFRRKEIARSINANIFIIYVIIKYNNIFSYKIEIFAMKARIYC